MGYAWMHLNGQTLKFFFHVSYKYCMVNNLLYYVVCCYRINHLVLVRNWKSELKRLMVNPKWSQWVGIVGHSPGIPVMEISLNIFRYYGPGKGYHDEEISETCFPQNSLWQEMAYSAFNGGIMVRKGIFWTIGEQSYFGLLFLLFPLGI